MTSSEIFVPVIMWSRKIEIFLALSQDFQHKDFEINKIEYLKEFLFDKVFESCFTLFHVQQHQLS